jgi:hypothetical protein
LINAKKVDAGGVKPAKLRSYLKVNIRLYRP